MPTTTKWPKPRNEDEFEDIVVDFCRIRWKDPHATRNGRRGQRQDGVDVVGHPPWLKGKTAGAQSKNTDLLTMAVILADVAKARRFKGGLSEFLIVTTAERDAVLQADVREHFKANPESFPVELIFWPDVVADIAGNEELVVKHWKGFGQGITSVGVHSLPAPVWFDRDSVRGDEKVECQCEFTVRTGASAHDIDSSELATELETIGREGVASSLVS